MYSFKNRYFSLITWFLLVILFWGFTTKDIPFDNNEKKQIEKAKKLNLDAQELIDKANSIYSEIAQYDTTNAETSKKVTKLENNALEEQLKALDLQKEANIIEYTVYTDVIARLKTNRKISLEMKLLEENIKELHYKAGNFRKEGNNLEKSELYQKYMKLSEAQDLEKASIVKQKELIDYLLGNNLQKKGSVEFDFTKYSDEIVINEDLLRAYLDYLSTNDPLITTDVFRSLLYTDSLSASKMRNVWDEYIYSELEPNKQEETVKAEIVLVEDEKPDEPIEETFSTKETEKTDEIENAVYKVQIAADNTPLDQGYLKQIYDGNKKVQMVSEDGWYKYSIGDFESYEEADRFRASLKGSGAFVVAYKENKKLDLFAVKEESIKYNEKKAFVSDADLIYKVQVAASRIRLNDSEIKNIYSGDIPVDMIPEDNWFKYSIGKEKTYDQAKQIKNSVTINGSFIVAYRNGQKVPLNMARGIKSTSGISSELIEFKVQIAANKTPLSSEKLHEIYSGYEEIEKFEEDGWYKYSIGSFNAFDKANELRKNCSVSGAFVIAFRGSEKLNVLDAKRMIDCYDPVIHKNWIQNNSTLVFKVQIVASLIELAESQIRTICCKESDVYLSKENEWYKYSIGSFKSYQEALKLKNISGVSGAFVVAYKNGKKVSIKEAVNISKR